MNWLHKNVFSITVEVSFTDTKRMYISKRVLQYIQLKHTRKPERFFSISSKDCFFDLFSDLTQTTRKFMRSLREYKLFVVWVSYRHLRVGLYMADLENKNWRPKNHVCKTRRPVLQEESILQRKNIDNHFLPYYFIQFTVFS